MAAHQSPNLSRSNSPNLPLSNSPNLSLSNSPDSSDDEFGTAYWDNQPEAIAENAAAVARGIARALAQAQPPPPPPPPMPLAQWINDLEDSDGEYDTDSGCESEYPTFDD
jgi:hypothetical protein